MRRVLRDFRTGLYLSHGHWIPDPGQAEVFPNLQAVEQLVAAEGIENAEMTLLEGNDALEGGVRVICPPNKLAKSQGLKAA
jgi:hypothetical protein